MEKKKTAKIKEEISKILNDKRDTKSPLLLWLDINTALEMHKINRPFLYDEFKPLFQAFQNTCRLDFNRAVDTFLSFLDTAPKTAELPAIPKTKKPKKDKKTRKDDLIFYKEVIDYLDLISDFLNLVAIKNYSIEKRIYDAQTHPREGYLGSFVKDQLITKCEKERQSCDYIRRYYGVPLENSNKDIETRINNFILDKIEFLKELLKIGFNDLYIYKNKRTANAMTWFVDVFGEASERYLPDWRQYQRKSKNMPDFKNSYQIFSKFAKGTTAKELGYTRDNYRLLRYEVVPQGVIQLLFGIHTCLYGLIDREILKIKQIREILNS